MAVLTNANFRTVAEFSGSRESGCDYWWTLSDSAIHIRTNRISGVLQS